MACRVVPGVEELQEDPLRPAVVVGVGGGDLAAPVVGEAEHLDLAPMLAMFRSVVIARVDAGLDGVLLGGQAEGVPAHRVQHVAAPHPLVAGEDVGGDVALGVADVQARAAGVGEHVEHVELGPGRVEARLARVGRAEGPVLGPVRLPLRLDRPEVVRRGLRGRTHVERILISRKPVWILDSREPLVPAAAWNPTHTR